MATKKIKKTEAYIDQRETFVSLQKSFADSELSVEEKLKTLYALQEADNKIDKIMQLRGELPGEVEELEQELASLKGKQSQGLDLIDEYNRSIETNKANIIEFDAQIHEYKGRLENIANSREYDSINKELENLDLLRQIAEKNINETRMAIADKKDELETLEQKIAARSEDLDAKREELAGIIESTSAQEKELVALREDCAAKIDARTMSAYDRIRKSVHNHLAVVSVFHEDSCGGCFNTITPQRLVDIASNKKLVICEHCGRIIVNPVFE